MLRSLGRGSTLRYCWRMPTSSQNGPPIDIQAPCHRSCSPCQLSAVRSTTAMFTSHSCRSCIQHHQCSRIMKNSSDDVSAYNLACSNGFESEHYSVCPICWTSCCDDLPTALGIAPCTRSRSTFFLINTELSKHDTVKLGHRD